MLVPSPEEVEEAIARSSVQFSALCEAIGKNEVVQPLTDDPTDMLLFNLAQIVVVAEQQAVVTMTERLLASKSGIDPGVGHNSFIQPHKKEDK